MSDGRAIRHGEAALNLVWVTTGLGIAASAWGLGVWTPAGPGGGFIGLVSGMAVAMGGLFLLLTREGAETTFRPDATAARRIVAVIAGLVAMALLIPLLGFIVGATLTLLVLLPLIERQRWVEIAGFSVTSTLVIWWVFDRLLGSTLPQGPFGF